VDHLPVVQYVQDNDTFHAREMQLYVTFHWNKHLTSMGASSDYFEQTVISIFCNLRYANYFNICYFRYAFVNVFKISIQMDIPITLFLYNIWLKCTFESHSYVSCKIFRLLVLSKCFNWKWFYMALSNTIYLALFVFINNVRIHCNTNYLRIIASAVVTPW
jgi:hypothetical protein